MIARSSFITICGPKWALKYSRATGRSSDVRARLGLGAPALARPEEALAFSNPQPSQGPCGGPGSGLARLQARAFSKPSTGVKPRLGGLERSTTSNHACHCISKYCNNTTVLF